MKRTGSSLLLLATLLALWELHTVCALTPARDPRERPGACPPPRYVDTNKTIPSPESYCDNDAGCSVGKKCCKDNNSNMCKPLPKKRPGQCPPAGATVRREDFCTTDSECAPNLKCCFRNGGYTCFPKIQDKPGTCKHNPLNCFVAGRHACDGDSGCPANEKCCSSGCGAQCMPPQKEYSG